MSSLLLMPSASNVVAISNWIFNLVHISSVIVTNWVPFTSAALRAAVHAFKQEDHVCEFTSMKAAKRKREQPEQQTEGSDGKTLALVHLSSYTILLCVGCNMPFVGHEYRIKCTHNYYHWCQFWRTRGYILSVFYGLKCVTWDYLVSLLQDLHVAGEQASSLDGSRPRGVQFPFAVGDQVLIKVLQISPFCNAHFPFWKFFKITVWLHIVSEIHQ